MATYSYKSSNTTPGTQQANSGSGKNRIYQIFEKTIELDELSLRGEKTPEKEHQNIEDMASMQYPFIKINDYMPSPEEIITMEIDSTDFIPTIKLKCTFLHQTFLSREMPKDGDIISVAIRNKKDMLKLIRNDYVITGVISSDNTTQMVGPTTMTFFGYLFIPWMSSNKFNFSFEGTTFEAMKKLAKDLGLGFATNEQDTDDKQVWISGFSTVTDFMKETIDRAWRDEQSFFDLWIDIYYNLNFINVNKQLMSSEEEVDTATLIDNIDKDYNWGNKSADDTVIETPKVLSNYDGFRTTPFYINSWKPINKATNITFQVGTKINCHLFEHNAKLYENPESEKNWELPMEPMYDSEKTKKYILLRGRATQDPSLRGDDLAKANYSYPDIYVKNPWMGIQYTISDSTKDNLEWDGNHHRNYLRAKIQNTINNKELDKLNVVVTVNGINANLIKGDKTPIVLIKKDAVESAMVNKGAGGNDYLEQFYSGWYYVKGFRIKYDHFNENSIMTNFRQDFVLTRREWPPPIAVEELKESENNV